MGNLHIEGANTLTLEWQDGFKLDLVSSAIVVIGESGGGIPYTNGEGLLLDGHEFSLDQDLVTEIAETAATMAQQAAESHADEVAQDALAEANQYTDTKVAQATTANQQYANEGDAAALADSKAYTDGEIDGLTTSLESYADAGDDAVYQAGKAYSDAADVAMLNASKAYTDSALTSVINDRGDYDASVGVFPTTGGTGPSGSVKKGNLWFIRVAGTLGSKAYNVDDTLRALADNPGQNPYLWGGGEGNLGFTPENRANKVNSLGSPDADTYPTTLAAYNGDQAVQLYSTNRANHTGSQSVSTITGLAPVATSGSKNDVGLGNVDNTPDSAKPVSTAQATAIGLKLNANATAVSASKLDTARNINGVLFDGTGDITVADGTKEPTITAGTTAQYWRGDKTWQAIPAQVQSDWNASSGLGVILNKPPVATRYGATWYISGRYYDHSYPLRQPVAGGVSMSARDVLLLPFVCVEDAIWSSLRFNVTTAATGSANIVIYDTDPTTNLPRNLIYQSGDLSIATTGLRSVTGLAMSMPKGVYWCGLWSKLGNTGTAQVVSNSSTSAQALTRDPFTASNYYALLLSAQSTVPATWTYSDSQLVLYAPCIQFVRA